MPAVMPVTLMPSATRMSMGRHGVTNEREKYQGRENPFHY